MAALARHTLGNILMYEVDADPNGVVPAPLGSLAMNSTAADVYQNTDGNTAWVKLAAGSGIGAFLTFGVANIGSSTIVRYLDPWYSAGTAVGPTTPLQYRLPNGGTLRNLRVRHNAPVGNSNLVTYTVRLDNAATALVLSLAADATDASDLVTEITASPGALIDIEITKAASIGAGALESIASLELI